MGTAKDRLIRATSWHAAGRAAAGVLGVVQSSYAFAALGEERYGLLTLVAALALLLVLAEMGLRTSTVHFVAGEAGRSDAAASREVLGTATLVHLASGAALGLPFALAAGSVADLFAVGGGLRGEAVGLLRWMAASLVLGNVASGWTSVLVALQRTGPVAAGMVAGGVAQLAATVAAVRGGQGAVSLGIGFAAGTAVRAGVEAAAAHRALPGVSILPWHASRAGLRRLLDLGRHLQVARTVDVLVFNLDQVLVSRFLGLGAGGVYRFASDLVLKLREVPLLLSSGVLPAAREVKDVDGGEALRRLYLRGTKYVVAAAALGASFAAAAAPEVLRAAGGPGAAEGAAAFALLCAGVLANVAVGVGVLVGIGIDRADLQARASLVTAAVCAVLVPAALFAGLGLAGAAAGTAAGLAAGAGWFLGAVHRALGVTAREALRTSYLPPLLPALGVAGAVLLLHRGPLAPILEGAGRGRLVACLAAEGAVLSLAYGAALWFAGWIDPFDRDVLRRALPFAAGKARP
jgi:O-antigen/teichoic acid export membrane protein